ncbi:MAG TPA: flagellar hook assembly protein FlgD [Lysobacter sp.]
MTTVSNSTTDSSLASLGLSVQQNQRSTSLGQADFLRLMTEQLKNQDPLKPLDNAQFLGQLAQFSTVQGIDKMQNAMQAVASVMESDQTLRAAALVGRDALVEADTLDVQAGTTVRGEIAATSAGPITVEIVDAAGTRVRTMTMQANAAGNVPFEWDGKNDAGQAMPGGTYTIRAAAGSGKDSEALAVGVAAKIDSVSIEPNGLVLNLKGLGSHPLSSIRRIG